MKLCYFDAFSGISGDMSVGALLDAGAPWEPLREALLSLNLGAEVRLNKVTRHGISASKFSVDAPAEKAHRHLPHIEKLIDRGKMSGRSKDQAMAVFRKLGEAEARAHAVPLEEVHFHEVGAVDSICDIVGACVALDLLEVEEVYSSRVNVGSGTVRTEHGTLPVPAPATAALLLNCPVYSSGPAFELTTPTGAALLSTLARGFGTLPPARLVAQGFGAGDKDFTTQANVLRVLIGERQNASEATSVSILEANIDDSTPQILGYATERLLQAGALDVTLTPIYMKKNRPGSLLSVICLPADTDRLSGILFAETSTLGVRVVEAQRRVLSRSFEQVQTRYGNVRVKYTDTGSFAPEYDDCRQIALQHGVPLRSVIAEAAGTFERLHPQPKRCEAQGDSETISTESH